MMRGGEGDASFFPPGDVLVIGGNGLASNPEPERCNRRALGHTDAVRHSSHSYLLAATQGVGPNYVCQGGGLLNST